MNKSFLFRLLLSFVSPRLFKNFVHWLFEDSAGKDEYSRTLVEQLYNDMRLAGTCFKPKAMVNPTRATSEELRNLQPPALFLVGENEKTFSARMAIERLNQVAPQIRTQMIARAGHDLNLAQSSLVEQMVLEFLE
jgi:pimeloyl-ACP methyl ester carboxylesterase